MSTPKMTLHTWVLIIVLATIWGSSFLFARIAVLEIPPLTLVFARVAIAALALNLLLMLRSNDYLHSVSMWQNFAIMGVLNNIIPFGLIFYGQLEIGAGLAAIINAMTPIWTVVIANFGTNDEKFTTHKVIGVILGFIGVAVLIGASLQNGWQASTVGQLAVFGATIADDDFAFDHTRCAGDCVGFAGICGLHRPDFPARGAIECNQAPVEGPKKHLVTPEGHSAIDDIATGITPLFARHFRIVTPSSLFRQ